MLIDGRVLARAGLAIAVIAITALSPILFLLNDFQYADFYNENVGFRFFWTMRWVDGSPDDFIHPGQGTLMPFIQALLYSISADNHILATIENFAALTAIGGIVLSAVIVLIIGMDPHLTMRARLALLAVPVVLALSHAHMFTYHLYPDYHAYEKPIILLASWFFVRFFLIAAPTIGAFAWFGLIVGTIAALKINLGPIILLLAIAEGKPLRFLITCATAAATFGVLLVCYYGFNPEWILRYFIILSNFTAGEWSFDWSALSPFASWRSHSMSNLTVYGLAMLALATVNASVRPRLFAVSVIMGGLAVAMCIKRGGGGSYFDASVIVVCLFAINIAASSRDRMAYAFLGAAGINVIVWCFFSLTSLATNNGLLLADYRPWQKTLYDWNLSNGLPILSIIPSNTYAIGTIEDMMMRGFSNFAHPWYDANDNISRKRLFPRHAFGTYTAELQRPVVVEWVETRAPLPFAGDFAEHNARMKFIIGDPGAECLTVDPPLIPYLRVHSCVLR